MKPAQQESKREQIRAAARSLFLQEGFAGTSMDAVTATAGISKQTLYRYYDSKAALFADVLGQLIAQPEPPAQPLALSDQPPTMAELEKLLIHLGEAFLARFLAPQQMALLRVVIAEGNRFPELVESFRSTLPAAGGAALISALEQGRASGVVADWLDIRTAARAFASILIGFILRDGLLTPQPRTPTKPEVADMVRIFLSGIGTHEGGSNG